MEQKENKRVSNSNTCETWSLRIMNANFIYDPCHVELPTLLWIKVHCYSQLGHACVIDSFFCCSRSFVDHIYLLKFVLH
jgi:hypothetical protein